MSDSKTARASAVKVVKEKHVETQDEAIKALRLNLDAGLHFGDISRVRHLLVAYDDLNKAYDSLDGQYDALDAVLGTANRHIKELEEQLDGELSGPVPLPDSTSGPCQAD